MPERAFVALGSNLGDRAKYLSLGRARLAELINSTVVAVSAVDKTEPIGPQNQDKYLNQMVLLETELSPRELLRHCHEIEVEAGRVRGEKWRPRTLDLDIVKFGEITEDHPDLTLPHPELPNRPFWQREILELERMASTVHNTIELPPWAHIDESRIPHVVGVAELAAEWAEEMGVSAAERARWHRAIVLHDTLKDAPKRLLDELAPDWWNIGSLRHGPAAAVMAEREGETDLGVLDAVRYHSVGYSQWDLVGKVLFLADYLERGRDFHTDNHDELIRRVPNDLEATLRAVAAERLSDVLKYDFPLLPETVEFWNSLVNAR